MNQTEYKSLIYLIGFSCCTQEIFTDMTSVKIIVVEKWAVLRRENSATIHRLQADDPMYRQRAS